MRPMFLRPPPADRELAPIDCLKAGDLRKTGTERGFFRRPEFVLERDLSFEDITVPAGLVVDGYSMPGWIVNAIWQPHDPRWLTAATLHDGAYELKLYGEGEEAREAADAMFYRAMRATGVHLHHRVVAWAAVRMGGGRGYGLVQPCNLDLVARYRKDVRRAIAQ